MKFHIKLLTAALALAASSVSFAAAKLPGEDLGVLTEYPTQFGHYRPGNEFRMAQPGDVGFEHEYFFTLGTSSTVIGSLAEIFFTGTYFSSVTLESAGLTVGSQTFADLSDVQFKFQDLAAGDYRLVVNGIYAAGNQAYSGSVYATAPVPEPESLALLLAGLGVTAVVAQRRKKKA